MLLAATGYILTSPVTPVLRIVLQSFVHRAILYEPLDLVAYAVGHQHCFLLYPLIVDFRLLLGALSRVVFDYKLIVVVKIR